LAVKPPPSAAYFGGFGVYTNPFPSAAYTGGFIGAGAKLIFIFPFKNYTLHYT
jgi:hypothetical protein